MHAVWFLSDLLEIALEQILVIVIAFLLILIFH